MSAEINSENVGDLAPTLRKPPWLRVCLPAGEEWAALRRRRAEGRLATVCEEAACPNQAECWGCGAATFMILGAVCTRGCRFCNVATARQGEPVDPDEPRRLADAVAAMAARHVVLTSVDRDDLADGGAGHFARAVEAIKALSPAPSVEILTPDFAGKPGAIEAIAACRADVLGHNLETVERLTPRIRDPRASYAGSLDVLRRYRRLAPGRPAKSALLLGLGETDEEVESTLLDLRAAGVDLLAIGQYLQPTRRHAPVRRYVAPEDFDRWRRRGEELGFVFVAAGPFVRSSYRAGEGWRAWQARAPQ